MAGLLSYVVSKPESPGAGNTIRAPEPLQCGHSRPALPLCDGAMSWVTDHLKFASAHLPWGSRRPRPFLAPSNYTDIDRTVAGGLSLNGKPWGRADDTVGIAGIINGISSVHEAFLNDGGLGILVGDGILPHPGLEQIIEAYYSYAVTSKTYLTFDYQLVVNPAYNTDRGPVNVFAGRPHWQF